MKLMVPVAGMIVAAGACCCCGGSGDMEEMFEGIADEVEGGGAADMDDAPDEAVAPASTGGVTAGLCGRFKSDGLSLPSGFNVIGCTVTSGTESLLAMGGTAPKDVCASVKSWATGSGWKVETEAEMSGTIALTLKSDASRMSLSCTDATGQTSVAVSITGS